MLRQFVIAAPLVVLAIGGFYAWARLSTYPAFPEASALADQAMGERGRAVRSHTK